ncbi:MAG: hypothetical protein ACRD5K_05995 [Candidatus Acidiferrales bacterium]
MPDGTCRFGWARVGNDASCEPELAKAASKEKVTVKVEDGSGAPIKSELVIVQDLNNQEHELLRNLTGAQGDVPALDLRPGLYRLIVTAHMACGKRGFKNFSLSRGALRKSL